MIRHLVRALAIAAVVGIAAPVWAQAATSSAAGTGAPAMHVVPGVPAPYGVPAAATRAKAEVPTARGAKAEHSSPHQAARRSQARRKSVADQLNAAELRRLGAMPSAPGPASRPALGRR